MSARKPKPAPYDLRTLEKPHVPCMGCSRARMATEAGFDWPCEGHDPGSTMAEMERHAARARKG